LGISAKKKLGTAVERNYMKRRLKEDFRVKQTQISGHYDIWFVMKKAFDKQTAAAAIFAFDEALGKFFGQKSDSR
jgi:ribonuclease P protein component